MGSTQGQRSRDVQTLAPIRNLVRLGRFNEAERSLASFITGSTNIEALMLIAICSHRLGNETALQEFIDTYGSRLSDIQKATIFRHQVLMHIANSRYDAALELLEAAPRSDAEMAAHSSLRIALTVLRNGQSELNSVFVMKPRSERAGIVPRSEIRSRYLSTAFGHCGVASVRTFAVDSMSLTYILCRHMTMRIEIERRDDERSNRLIRAITAELGKVDEQFKRSLPSLRRQAFRRTRHTF